MAGVVNKLWNMISMNGTDEDTNEEEFDEDMELDEQEELEDEEPKGLFGRKSSKVVGMQQPVRMVILQPTTFEQSGDICNLLREKKSIIVNVEYVNKDVARRIIDVVSGAVKVLDGHMQKISNSIFLIAPYNYDISSDATEEAKTKLSAGSWLKTNLN